jgi:hypothetical protein
VGGQVFISKTSQYCCCVNHGERMFGASLFRRDGGGRGGERRDGRGEEEQ